MHSKPGAHMWKTHQKGSPPGTAQMLMGAVVRARQGHVDLPAGTAAALMKGRIVRNEIVRMQTEVEMAVVEDMLGCLVWRTGEKLWEQK